jgi:lysine 2,3-aminomutase
MTKVRYIRRVEDLRELTPPERVRLARVAEKFPFCANEYYLGLLDWHEVGDPLRRIIIPDPAELEEWGSLDASGEARFTVMQGLEHKYAQTALLIVSNRCGGYCRFCFRKRLFMRKSCDVVANTNEALAYIAGHPEITDVLLSGGDPLYLSTSRLEEIVRRIREIDHVRIIRIGSKMPAYNPSRILGDPALFEMIHRYSTAEKRIYVMTQFNHPRELTGISLDALNRLHHAGAILANQTPILRGVNDNADILAELFRNLSFAGVAPYYLFQCRPTLGNHHFVVPVEEAYQIFERAKAGCSGLAKRPRFVMSHATGKIAVVGLSDGEIYLKYHQAARRRDIGKFMAFPRNSDALWFDDYIKPLTLKPMAR